MIESETRKSRMRLNRLVACVILGLFLIPVVNIASPASAMPMGPGGAVPHYFGPYPNYATSQLPNVTYDANGTITSVTGGIRKFVDSLPGLGEANANNLGNYLPIAIADNTTYPGSDYYEIAAVEFEQQMHSDLNPTKLRGYVQLETSANFAVSKHVPLMYLNGTPILKYNGSPAIAVDNPLYLGPFIIAQKDVPVRVKFTNLLPTGVAGDLFLPVDTTVMGAGMGPLGMVHHIMVVNHGSGYTSTPTVTLIGGGGAGATGNAHVIGGVVDHIHVTNGGLGYSSAPTVMITGGGGSGATADATIMYENYTQNRATLHLHGGRTPWISDGTPHQWLTPAGENTQYPEGVSVYNVPDMPDPGPGSMTFYYTNQQSARLMFYHDHSYGITRLNVYAGEAAGYVLQDDVELALVSAGIIPAEQIPLVIQDKTFVPDNTTAITNMWGTFDSQLAFQDPTWNTTTWGAPGDLWYPHVYMTMANPYDPSGMSMFGRWMYSPWFWPPQDPEFGPIPNPYYDPMNPDPMEPPMIPGVPFVSSPGEAFMDTPVINGVAYPFLEIEPKAYRFRILNAADDRFFNLQLYVADGSVVTADGRVNTEVKMVPAVPTFGYPEGWPTDGREGGVPDPATAGPEIIQIANEGGFLPAPVTLPNQPVDWNWDMGTFDMGILAKYTLLLGTAERADVIIDFSQFAGQTLILYNDCPAPVPASDPRQDYFTGHPDFTDSGGSQTTVPGFGSNTRTLMQIRVNATTPAPVFDRARLNDAFNHTVNHTSVFEDSQNDIIVPQAYYNSAYNASFPTRFANIFTNSMTFTPIGETTPVTLPFEQAKAIQDEMGEAYDHKYGRMAVLFGLQVTTTLPQAQTLVLYGFASPPTEVQLAGDVYGTPMGTLSDGTQIWKIVHNGVDTHPVHWHMFEVQLINRVAWDNNIREPDANELGWKETLRVNPLQNTIVALRPVQPNVPFDLPNSVRPLDPTMPIGAVLDAGAFSPNAQPITVTNHMVNFGWEYVWHCHILAHEENDMMRVMAFAIPPRAPTGLVVKMQQQSAILNWTDRSLSETGFVIERATNSAFTTGLVTFEVGAGVTNYVDSSSFLNIPYYFRVKAINTVGDTWNYSAGNPAVENFPTLTVSSAYSNTQTFGPKFPHARIYIDGNAQFTPWNGVVSGSGTALDPYIIEKWIIAASGGHGISIRNTNAYFIIRNCDIQNGGTTYFGVYLQNVFNGVLSFNNASNNQDGFYVKSSGNIVLSDNIANFNNLHGILLFTSNGNAVINNTCRSNANGVYVYLSSNNILSGNNCTSNTKFGTVLDRSTLTQVTGNKLSGSAIGAYLYLSNSNTLIDNICLNNIQGMYLSLSTSNTVSNNNCSNNVIGIILSSSSSNTLSNNTYRSNQEGIYLRSSSNVVLNDNSCTFNTKHGITLYLSSSNNMLSRNMLSNNQFGIWFTLSSNNNVMVGENYSNNLHGMWITSSSGNSISESQIRNNTYFGIRIDSGSSNIIWNNTLVFNRGAGAIWSALHVQGYDAGTNNHWNSTSGYGNYWSDWTFPDNNLDGIVDSPYVLMGAAGARDYRPLAVLPV